MSGAGPTVSPLALSSVYSVYGGASIFRSGAFHSNLARSYAARCRATALPELAPDSTFGPYRIVRLLGRGGMGAAYEAENRTDGRVVALKLLSVDVDKMDARARFLREGLTAAAINHPNTVYIYGTEEIEGTPAISMELVPGGTLEEKVQTRGSLPWKEAVDDILQVIDGLDAALAAGVLHLDVKPSNCFVGSDGTVKIGDFGLSRPIAGDEQLKLTQTGVFLGTPVFSSPEQLLGESLDVRSDIYAVGVTFYSLLTSALPYPSGSMMQVVAAVLNGSPTPLTQYRNDCRPTSSPSCRRRRRAKWRTATRATLSSARMSRR